MLYISYNNISQQFNKTILFIVIKSMLTRQSFSKQIMSQSNLTRRPKGGHGMGTYGLSQE